MNGGALLCFCTHGRPPDLAKFHDYRSVLITWSPMVTTRLSWLWFAALQRVTSLVICKCSVTITTPFTNCNQIEVKGIHWLLVMNRPSLSYSNATTRHEQPEPVLLKRDDASWTARACLTQTRQRVTYRSKKWLIFWLRSQLASDERMRSAMRVPIYPCRIDFPHQLMKATMAGAKTRHKRHYHHLWVFHTFPSSLWVFNTFLTIYSYTEPSSTLTQTGQGSTHGRRPPQPRQLSRNNGWFFITFFPAMA